MFIYCKFISAYTAGTKLRHARNGIRLLFAMTLAGAGLAGADSIPDAKGTAAALKAYAAMDYTQAGKLARTIPHTPEGRPISGLCDVYDRTRQDIRRGQLPLAELFYNDKTQLPYRLEAGDALANQAYSSTILHGSSG